MTMVWNKKSAEIKWSNARDESYRTDFLLLFGKSNVYAVRRAWFRRRIFNDYIVFVDGYGGGGGDGDDGGIKTAFKRFGIGIDAHMYVYTKTACVHKDDAVDKDKVNIYFGLEYINRPYNDTTKHIVCSMPYATKHRAIPCALLAYIRRGGR